MIARDAAEFERAARGLPRNPSESAGQLEIVCLHPDTYVDERGRRRRLCIVRDVNGGLRVVSTQ